MFKHLVEKASYYQNAIDLCTKDIAASANRLAKIPTPDITRTMKEMELHAFLMQTRVLYYGDLHKLLRSNKKLRNAYYQNAVIFA